MPRVRPKLAQAYPINLDMPTVSLVSISVTAILGLILIFAWWQERASALTGWWGAAQIVMSLSIVVAFTASIANDANLLALGQAKIDALLEPLALLDHCEDHESQGDTAKRGNEDNRREPIAWRIPRKPRGSACASSMAAR